MSESVKNNKSERDLVPILQDKVIELQVSYEKARIEKEDLKSTFRYNFIFCNLDTLHNRNEEIK